MSFEKINILSDSLVEPDKDANTLLTDLDKGLRSGNIGEQCEAIVRFPRLFEKYPFPIIINSSYLKLADVFRVGSNFLRIWVLRVCQQTEKHLDKILNVDEFVRRIFSVIHSNDPVARALTLRTLGSVAGIIPERQQVHHGIRSSLESHDAVEVEAAIMAAAQFAAQSKKFAVSMCNKVSEMIQGLATPSHRKLQLIPILQHMHHDTTTASMVRALCHQLLLGYPTEEFVLVTLSTLTELASATLIDIPEQVTLLVQYLRDDPRWTVKAGALQGLKRLAREGANLWSENAVNDVIEVAWSTGNPALLNSALDVLSVLANSALTCHHQINSESQLMRLAKKCSKSENTRIAAKAIRILASLLSYSFEERVPVTGVEEMMKAIDTLFFLSTHEPVRQVEVRTCLQAMVKLCRANPELAQKCVAIIAGSLFRSESCNVLLCEALGAIGGKKATALRIILPEMVEKLRKLSRQSYVTESKAQTQVILSTLLFQCQLDHVWNAEVRHSVILASSGDNNWTNFQIARAAARYGHHEIAYEIFGRLKNQVSSEHLYFWLKSLEELSRGEAALQGEEGVIARLSTALTHHSKALASLKVAGNPTQSMQFQTEYVKVRCEFLQCLVQLVHASHSLCTAPPPAIAAAFPYHSRDELQRFGQVASQLQKSVKEFRSCGEMYQKLYQSAFDADPESLANVQVYQQICLLVANSVEKVCSLAPQEEFSLDLNAEEYGLEVNYLVERCRAAMVMVEPILNNKDIKPITHQHVNALIQQVQHLAETSFCLPRFFFQTLQSTSIKLNISPMPRVAGESHMVLGGSQLAVKVEGVICHGLQPGRFRRVAAIVVNLQSQLQSRQHSQPDAKSQEVGSTVTQSVTPHRDFFSAQFLLAFPIGGQYTLSLEVAIADENGHIWRTGPRSTLPVKYHEENKGGSNQSAARSFAPPRQY